MYKFNVIFQFAYYSTVTLCIRKKYYTNTENTTKTKNEMYQEQDVLIL